MIKVIIFDYYGVIAQDAFWYRVKGLEAGKHKSEYIQKLSDEVNLDKISWHEFCEAVSQDIGVPVDEVRRRYDQHQVRPGIVELISALASKYRVVLLSNANEEQLLPVMRHLGLDKLFERVFVSSEIGSIKPDPKAFLYVAEQLGIESDECILIDDSERNIISAKQLGMKGIVFKNPEDCSSQLHALL
jgi:putative hydrolase of the HAD superfamily